MTHIITRTHNNTHAFTHANIQMYAHRTRYEKKKKNHLKQKIREIQKKQTEIRRKVTKDTYTHIIAKTTWRLTKNINKFIRG